MEVCSLSLSLVTQWTVSVCPLERGTTGRLRSNFRWISKLLRSQGVSWHKTVTSPCLLTLQREAIAFTHTEQRHLHTPRSSIPSSLPSSPSSVSAPAQSHPHILYPPPSSVCHLHSVVLGWTGMWEAAASVSGFTAGSARPLNHPWLSLSEGMIATRTLQVSERN